MSTITGTTTDAPTPRELFDEPALEATHAAEAAHPQVAALRKEAARYRARVEALETRAATLVADADFDARVAALAEENRTLRATLAASAAGLPLEMAARLQGTTDEELAEDAVRLRDLLAAHRRPALAPRRLRAAGRAEAVETARGR